MATHFVLQTIAQGDGRAIASRSVQGHLVRLESSQPEHTHMQLVLAWRPFSLPVVGPIDLAGAAATAVNAAYRATRFVAPWEGDTLPATADHHSRTTTIRWIKMAPGVAAVLGAIEDGTADAAAAEAAPEVAVGISVATLIAAAIAGFLVWQFLTHWQFSREVVKKVETVIHGVAGDILLLGAAGLTVYLILRRR